MNVARQKLHDFYNFKKGAKIYQAEFGYYSLERWTKEGHINDKTDLAKLFGLDDNTTHTIGYLGWCEAELVPSFESIVLEDRGEYELIQDCAGRGVLVFKGRRNGFMPEYVTHPVKDEKTFEELILPRLNPNSKERYIDLDNRVQTLKKAAEDGYFISQNIIGGYMFLRSLMGPEEVLYAFYDQPELIHKCMKAWFELADRVTTEHQKHVSFDEVFLAEDICYNCGPLIAPDMMREFLFPYYNQLLTNIKSRQIDKQKHLFVQIDTDGNCVPVLDTYKEIGMDYICPLEVASNCDVVEIRKNHPDLLMRGGIDKRILAKGKEAIAKEVDRIMPFMTQNGGYIPTCDHGVPEEVSFEDYMYYRELMKNF